MQRKRIMIRTSLWAAITFVHVLLFPIATFANGLVVAMKNYEKGKNEIVKNISEVKKSPCNTMILSTKIGLIEGALNRHVARVKDTVNELNANIKTVENKFAGTEVTSCAGITSSFEKEVNRPVSLSVTAAKEKLKKYRENFVKDSGQVKAQKSAISSALGKPECADAKTAFQNGMDQTENLPKKMDALIAAVDAQREYPDLVLKGMQKKLKCN